MLKQIRLCCLLLCALCLGAESVHFLTQPAISPDGSQVVFCFMGDIWQVAATGGSATRLTALPGEESQPRCSPDGQWLAFSANPEGNRNVYILPLAGGEIRQLTVHSADDTVSSWSWDSQLVYFTSDRESAFKPYRISTKGGTPTPLFEGFFTNMTDLLEAADGQGYYFIDSMEGHSFPQRKRYKGALNPEILFINKEGCGLKVLAPYEGKDMWPMSDREGKIYFASDRQGGEYNLFTLDGDQAVALTQFDRSIRDPQISADGSRVVFEKDYQLFICDTKTRVSQPLNVDIPFMSLINLPEEIALAGHVSSLSVSKDAKKLALVSRGLLFVSDAKGQFVRQLPTNPRERVKEVHWCQDDRALIYNQTVEGWLNWFIVPADACVSPRAITWDQQSNRSLNLSPDGQSAVYLSGRNELRLLDMKTHKSRLLVKDEFWAFRGSSPVFSPDGRYIAFTAYRNFEQDVLISDLNGIKIVNVTDSGVSEMTPIWSADGKYLYLSANRLQPSFPRGEGNTKVFRLALQRFAQPFRSQKAAELFTEVKKTIPDKKKSDLPDVKPVIIEWQGLEDRWQQIGVESGSQNLVDVWQDKDKSCTFYISDHQGENELWLSIEEPFCENKHLPVTGLGKLGDGDLEVYFRTDGAFILSMGKVFSLDLGTQKAVEVDVHGRYQRRLQDEFEQMFFETWANMDENFYDDQFHGLDWLKTRDYYRQFLAQVRSRTDLRRLLNDMMGELNASHLGFRSQGEEEKVRNQMVSSETGIRFAGDDPYLVQGLVPRSAAFRQQIDVRRGDRLIGVNGIKVDPGINRFQYFTAPSLAEELELELHRQGKSVQVRVHPDRHGQLVNQYYSEWEDLCQARVDEWGGKRIAYVHMRDMGGESLERFLIEMTSEWHRRDALILDLRYNRGGNVHDAVLNFLSQRPYSKWKYRGGAMAPQPNFAPAAKPVVLLVNEQSLSDAEVTGAGFKALGLGPVIGTETYRWIIFTTAMSLVDGSFHRMPSWGCYSLEGQDLEKSGVQPDIYVKNTIEDKINGRDPQLRRAVDEVLKMLRDEGK